VSKSYSFEPVPDGVEAKYILGGQANLWTEQIPSLRYAEYMTYPRAWALAEVYWSPGRSEKLEQFCFQDGKTLPPVRCCRGKLLQRCLRSGCKSQKREWPVAARAGE
jgi:N-acetyl-beta-hexosaminidase